MMFTSRKDMRVASDHREESSRPSRLGSAMFRRRPMTITAVTGWDAPGPP